MQIWTLKENDIQPPESKDVLQDTNAPLIEGDLREDYRRDDLRYKPFSLYYLSTQVHIAIHEEKLPAVLANFFCRQCELEYHFRGALMLSSRPTGPEPD